MPAEPIAETVEVDKELARKILARIEKIRTGPVNPRLANFTGSYLFSVEGVGNWKVALDHGTKTVTTPPAAPEGEPGADCNIYSDAKLFLEVAEGRQNLITAYMQGRLDIEGDMALAQKLNSILPAPEKAKGRQGGAA